MKNLKNLLAACLMTLAAFSLHAQDIHFSQFYLSPLNLNPAMTGVMNCNSRVVANYRNQWASVLRSNAFSTYSVSYDQRIPVGRYDFFGVGGTFWGDRAGESNFSTLTGKASLSYSKRMGGTRNFGNYLVAGAEAGVAQRSIDFLNLRWGTQHDGAGGFDPNLPTQENRFNRDNFLFADMGAGLLWFMVMDENTNFYIGGAFHHLNRSNQSFSTEDEDLLYSRVTGHVGGEFLVGDKFGLVPGVIVMKQGPSFQVNGGTSFKFLLSKGNLDYQAFQIGLWGRIGNKFIPAGEGSSEAVGILSDAAIISTRFDYNNFSLGFSYDINVSPLRTASNANGGFEFAMVYKICGQERRGVYCPNF
ncbi:MAG TPA: PorP/SprF family type IX secretion system membrane protein [Saprospiraceae bacterium]|nr:PorP/SprF family type IX secretion system membrane protein [Saprospiraceae bacterium]HMP23824.1 PorP/SprF family type IX secretion system membrane protein [Saprospiraceae bacterium]